MPSPSLSQDFLASSAIDSDAKAAIAEFLPRLEKELPAAADLYFAHLKRNPDLARSFSDRDAMTQARNAFQAHIKTLFACRFDAGYMASLHEIAKIDRKSVV